MLNWVIGIGTPFLMTAGVIMVVMAMHLKEKGLLPTRSAKQPSLFQNALRESRREVMPIPFSHPDIS